jgi:hypothetical protein
MPVATPVAVPTPATIPVAVKIFVKCGTDFYCFSAPYLSKSLANFKLQVEAPNFKLQVEAPLKF